MSASQTDKSVLSEESVGRDFCHTKYITKRTPVAVKVRKHGGGVAGGWWHFKRSLGPQAKGASGVPHGATLIHTIHTHSDVKIA